MNQTKQTVSWPGASGKSYTYYVYPRGATFTPGQPGNYIHAKVVNGYWQPVYIGQTGDLNERLRNHEQQNGVDRNGATHLHVHTNSTDEKVRRVEEKDLIVKWKPICNTQHT